MKTKTNPIPLLSARPFVGWVLLAIVSACGGGGGGASSPAPQPPLIPSTLVLLSALPSAGGVQVSLSYGKTGTQPIHLMVDTGIGTPVLLQDSFKPPQTTYFLALPATSEYRITLDQGLSTNAEIRSTVYDSQKIVCKNTQVLDFPIASVGYASWMTATDPDHILCINAVQGTQMNIIQRMGGLLANTPFHDVKADIRIAYPGGLRDSKGILHFIYFLADYSGAYHGTVIHATFDGTAVASEFIAQRTINPATAVYGLQFCIDPTDRIHVLWQNYPIQFSNGVQLQEQVEYALGSLGSWTTEIVPRTDPVDGVGYAHQFRLSVTSDGVPHVASGFGTIVRLASKQGGQWSEELVPTGAALGGLYEMFEIFSVGDKTALFFTRPFPSPNPDGYFYMEKSGGTWTTPELISYRPFNGSVGNYRAGLSPDGSTAALAFIQTSGINQPTWAEMHFRRNGSWVTTSPFHDYAFGGPGPILNNWWMGFSVTGLPNLMYRSRPGGSSDPFNSLCVLEPQF